jgi:hypothetical protein
LRDHERLDRVAAAGNARTLREHTFEIRMREILDILNKHVRA